MLAVKVLVKDVYAYNKLRNRALKLLVQTMNSMK